jgi:EAL domain-containing protein (putative c-di-GMP-specific phosphodiesterase class I)
MPPRSICFEVTETAAIANFDKAARFFGEMKSLGCLFSLDDFGAGMSSFGYLKHLPVDFIKIDGSFVKNVAYDEVDRATVQAINDVGHVMGKKTIGEFVDGEMGLVALREMGVDFAQGDWIGPPVPFVAQPAASARTHAVRTAAAAVLS